MSEHVEGGGARAADAAAGTPEAPVPVDPPRAGEDAPEELEWRRVHAATPAIRSWKAFVGILAIIGWQLTDNVGDLRDFVVGGGWRWILLGIFAVVLVAAIYSFLAWRFTRYAVGESAVHLHTGIVFRQQRQARLDRLQSVDVVRPLLARLAGLSQLTLEVAGATGSNVELAYLRDEDAVALRAELLAKAAGVRPRAGATPAGVGEGGQVEGAPGEEPIPAGSPGADAAAGAAAYAAMRSTPARPVHEEAPERTVIELPLGRLAGSIALSGTTLFFLVLAGVLIVLPIVALSGGFGRDALREMGGIGGLLFLLPALLGLASFVWTQFSTGYGFRAAISPDGIRLSRGLLETRAQTIAPGRVQALEIVQPLLWRKPGWYKVRMNVAGYGDPADVAGTQTTLLPVGDLDQALLACWLVLPDLGTDDAVGALTNALHGTGPDGGFTIISRRARPIAPFTYRREGFLVTARALVLRLGRVTRRVQIVPHERTQSLGIEQGPLARALRVASFTVHSVTGPVRPGVANLDLAVAARLMDEQSARARAARAQDRTERWMDPEA